MSDEINKIKNADKLIKFFGKWPSFHDSEILSVLLDRQEPSLEIAIYTFLITDEVDERGNYKRDRECIVVIKFSSIQDLEIGDFNQQNVISGINFEQKNNNIEVKINSIYGLYAEFNCETVSIASIDENKRSIRKSCPRGPGKPLRQN